jgi:hypothetical protein
VLVCHVRSVVDFLSGSAETQQYSQGPQHAISVMPTPFLLLPSPPQAKAEMLT